MYRVVVKFGSITFRSDKVNSIVEAMEIVDNWGQTQVPHGPFVHAVEQRVGNIWEVV